MRVYFAWCELSENFDPVSHAREDLKIFTINIHQREGEVASAKISVSKDSLLHLDKSVFISVETNGEIIPIFKGALIGMPVVQGESLIHLRFAAIPVNWEAQVHSFSGVLKKTGYFDERICEDTPQGWLSAYNLLWFFDPVSHVVELRNINEFRDKIDAEGRYLTDSLKVNINQLPLGGVDVKARVAWQQEAGDEVNLFQMVARRFKGRIITSLNPRWSWPKVGSYLQNSGYLVTESLLRQVRAEDVKLWPLESKKDNKLNLSRLKNIKLNRHYYTGKFVVQWTYRQRREEHLDFRLRNPLYKLFRRSKTLKFTIPDVGRSALGHFWPTMEAKPLIDCMVNIAKAYLKASQNCVVMEVKLPLYQSLRIQLGTLLYINQKLCGRISEYNFHIECDYAYVWVRAFGNISQLENLPNRNTDCLAKTNYALTEVDPNSYQGVRYPLALGPYDILEGVEIRNDAEEQELYLSNQIYHGDSKAALKEIPTQIHLQLKNLETYPKAIYKYQLIFTTN